MRTSFTCPWSITSVRLVQLYCRIKAALAWRASVTRMATFVGADGPGWAEIVGGHTRAITITASRLGVFIALALLGVLGKRRFLIPVRASSLARADPDSPGCPCLA